MEDRIVLQMDHAAPVVKGLQGTVGECSEIADTDCPLGICPGGHRKEAIHAQTGPLRDPTGPERLDFRKKCL